MLVCRVVRAGLEPVVKDSLIRVSVRDGQSEQHSPPPPVTPGCRSECADIALLLALFG